jgi:hypothetical protein
MTTLEINGISATAEENIASYLSVLEQKDVPLQDIVLGGCLTTHTFSLLHMFTCLKSLNLILTSATLLSSDFLSWRNLPSLTHLAINMDQYCIYDENTTQPQNSIRVRFEKLQYLQFGGPSVLILKLLQAMDILESLATIRLTCPMSAELVTSLIGSIKECARISPFLKDFVVHVQNGNYTTVLPETTIPLLHGCKHLTVLGITGISLAVNDNVIRGLCGNNSWINLRNLFLPPSCDNNRPSLLCLGMIARNLPNIIELQISIDFQLQTSESLYTDRAGNSRIRHGLKRLDLINIKPLSWNTNDPLSMKMVIGISRYIEHYFPNLESPKLSSVSRFADLTKNQPVPWWWTLIKEFRAVREEASSDATQFQREI